MLKMGTSIQNVTGVCDKVLAGLPQLLDDLQKLSDDHDSADIVFLVGQEEERIYSHRLILKARCKSFQIKEGASISGKRGTSFFANIPGSTISPGTPTLIRLPHLSPDVFRQFILYIYTAKIILQDSRVFEFMNLAQDLGIYELKQACEDHVINTLSVSNACTFLLSAMEINEKRGGKCTQNFVDRCITFIGENASECVKTNAFLNLTKEALIKIISSDYLCLEEEDVWRAVLAWSKHQGGVTQPVAHWTEEERARVCKHLTPVIGHVRILLIDSQVFAEEIEPTGCIPIEMSLERYRYAALECNKLPGGPPIQVPPGRMKGEIDKRLTPRLSLNLFPGSNILRNDKMIFQSTLNSWFGNNKQTWRLIYRASVHGFSSAAFHRHCDRIAPLFVIAVSRGEVFGGFTDVPWTVKNSKRGGYIHSERAFLFTLNTSPPTKFNVIKKSYAICYHQDCGPIFGAGADFLISNCCNTNMDSYSNMPHSYNGPGTLFSDYNFSIQDYEVFTIDGNFQPPMRLRH